MRLDRNRARSRLVVYSLTALLGAAFAIYFIYAIAELILPVIVAVLLAYIVRPVVGAFKYPWLPDWIRLTLILGLLAGGSTWLFNQVRSSIPSDTRKLELRVRAKHALNAKYEWAMGIDSATPQGNGFYKLFRGEFDGLILRANQMLSLTDSETQAFLASRPTPASEDPFFRAFLANAQHPRFGNDARADQALNSQTGATPTAVTEGQKSSTSLAHLLSIWIVTPLILLFLLFDDGQIVRWFVRLVPNRYFELTLTIFDEVDAAMGRYLRGTFLQCGLVGLTIAVGLVLVGLTFEAALLIGAIAGLANAIPFLGPAIGLVISLGYVLVADQITPLLPGMTPDHVFIGVIATIAVAQTLDNIYFQPVVLGAAVNLHPIVVVIGVMAASSMFGFAGMLLAIPAIVIVKVVVETLFTELKAYRII